MTGTEPDTAPQADSGARHAAAPGGGAALGARPIRWRWWVLAAILSLGLWAGMVFLVA